MFEPRSTEIIRRFDSRGEALAGTRSVGESPRLPLGPARAELPLGAWRRREPAQSNVITLRIPSWASSSSKP
jgi:hypothetical protein